MKIDPICGMKVDEATPLKAIRGTEVYYFCSEHCRKKFIAQEPSKTPSPSAPASEPGGCCGGGAKAKPAETSDCCGTKEVPKPKAEEHSCCSSKSGDHEHSHHNHGGEDVKPSAAAKYFCPMCPGVESDKPGDCPKCGMALELNPSWSPEAKTIYTCPMHPEVQQDHPGDCPKCGMPLEPKEIVADADEPNHEAKDMSRRFWVGLALALPVLILAMWEMISQHSLRSWLPAKTDHWIQFALSTPVVLWAGWPFFVRGWRSIRTWNLNMFTLIALGVGTAYTYSIVALFFPHVFPASFHAHGRVPLYFEAASVITVLVLLGQMLEAKARSQTGAAIKALLNKAAKSARVVRDGVEKEISVAEVIKGDTLRVRPGEKVPVDGFGHRRTKQCR